MDAHLFQELAKKHMNPLPQSHGDYHDVESSIASLSHVAQNLSDMKGSFIYLGAGDDAPYMLFFPASTKVGIDRWYTSYKQDSGENPDKSHEFFMNLIETLGPRNAVKYLKKDMNVEDHTVLRLPDQKIHLERHDGNLKEDSSDLVNKITHNYGPVKMLLFKGLAKYADMDVLSSMVAPGGYVVVADRYYNNSHNVPALYTGMKKLADIILPINREINTHEFYTAPGAIYQR